jgi:hypothetical protein
MMMLKGINIIRKPRRQREDNDSNDTDEQSNKRQKLERDSWMLAPPTEGLFGRSSSQQQQQQQQPVIEKPRELNPYFATNGTGLPQQETSDNTILSSKGANWRARALKRAQERAHEEGRTVGSVIQDRWGVTSSDLAQSVQRRERSTNHQSYSKQDEIDHKIRRSELESMHRSRMVAPSKNSSHDNLRWKNKESDKPARETQKESSKLSQESARPVESRFESVPASVTQQLEYDGDPITEEELNKLAGRAMKAQLLGNQELYENLTKELEGKKKIQEAQSGGDVVLSKFDSRGKLINQESRSNADESVNSMVRDIKERGVNSFDNEFLNTMGQNTKYSKGDWEDEYDETENGLERFGTRNQSTKALSNKRAVQKKERHEKSQRERQIREHRKQQNSLDQCPFCFKTSKTFKKHMIIALGDKAFLTLPPYGSLVTDHCIITTLEHHTSMYETDESEWYEVQKFKQSLKKMFAAQNKDVIFMETVTPYSQKKNKHSFIECIPLPYRLAQEAPSYFKKAILESESEWSQNKKLIDTRGKGIKKSIPPDFPYFHVEFGLNGGFAHVIEDETKFSYLFGKEVVCGILRMNNNEAKLRSLSEDQEKKNVVQFLQQFKDYDWTIELEGGDY